MSDAHGAPGSSDGGTPWSLPDDFLDPADDLAGPSIAVNLRDVNQNQVMKLAQEYNRNHCVDQDPFEAVLAGIPERAQLRPGSKEPISLYMGLQGLPPHGRYAKAWRKLLRPMQLQLDDKDQQEPAAKVSLQASSKEDTAYLDMHKHMPDTTSWGAAVGFTRRKLSQAASQLLQ